MFKFLKPTLSKIIISIILTILSFLTYFYASLCALGTARIDCYCCSLLNSNFRLVSSFLSTFPISLLTLPFTFTHWYYVWFLPHISTKLFTTMMITAPVIWAYFLSSILVSVIRKIKYRKK